ncbi:MAG: hypothetical protein ACYDBB_17255 [Armatimonadota bacterium]
MLIMHPLRYPTLLLVLAVPLLTVAAVLPWTDYIADQQNWPLIVEIP